MKLLDLLWWFFDIGGEKTSPDVQQQSSQATQHDSTASVQEQELDDEHEFEHEDLDEFFEL